MRSWGNKGIANFKPKPCQNQSTRQFHLGLFVSRLIARFLSIANWASCMAEGKASMKSSVLVLAFLALCFIFFDISRCWRGDESETSANFLWWGFGWKTSLGCFEDLVTGKLPQARQACSTDAMFYLSGSSFTEQRERERERAKLACLPRQSSSPCDLCCHEHKIHDQISFFAEAHTSSLATLQHATFATLVAATPDAMVATPLRSFALCHKQHKSC